MALEPWGVNNEYLQNTEISEHKNAAILRPIASSSQIPPICLVPCFRLYSRLLWATLLGLGVPQHPPGTELRTQCALQELATACGVQDPDLGSWPPTPEPLPLLPWPSTPYWRH